MKLVSAFVGLAALGGVALFNGAVSAQPIEVPGASGVIPSGYICNEWGHCWHRHSYGGGYYHPQYWGGGYGWHHHWDGGWRWRRWHHWHRW
ncbi:hypothetical protein [uncultured Bradyrhizobium sp.]|uniref:hypothetical protein n=1 Tax=uncultured Bradyrhizobium sp. TaxID=199684 RepID=UPI0026116C31|nr:hypothetical protein [uncultured Bradyrhizobium sp.]